MRNRCELESMPIQIFWKMQLDSFLTSDRFVTLWSSKDVLSFPGYIGHAMAWQAENLINLNFIWTWYCHRLHHMQLYESKVVRKSLTLFHTSHVHCKIHQENWLSRCFSYRSCYWSRQNNFFAKIFAKGEGVNCRVLACPGCCICVYDSVHTSSFKKQGKGSPFHYYSLCLSWTCWLCCYRLRLVLILLRADQWSSCHPELTFAD